MHKATASSTAKEIAEELEKMVVEKASKKKIAEFTNRLKEEYIFFCFPAKFKGLFHP